MKNRIKTSDIKELRLKLLEEQNYECKICDVNLKKYIKSNPNNINLDHCHITGFIRYVLCRRCNAIEGKFYNNYKRLTRKDEKSLEDKQKVLLGLAKYIMLPTTKLIHPTFLTDDEKKEKRKRKVKRNRKKVTKG